MSELNHAHQADSNHENSASPKLGTDDAVAQTSVAHAAEIGATRLKVKHNMGFEENMPILLNNGSILNKISKVNFDMLVLSHALESTVQSGSTVRGYTSIETANSYYNISPNGDSMAIDNAKVSHEGNDDQSAVSNGNSISSRISKNPSEKGKEIDIGLDNTFDKSEEISHASRHSSHLAENSLHEFQSNKHASISLNAFGEHNADGINGSERKKANKNGIDLDELEENGGIFSSLLRKGSMINKLFETNIEQRYQRENEGRRREEVCYDEMNDPANLRHAQTTEAKDPKTLSQIIRVLLFFNGKELAEDPEQDDSVHQSSELPMLNGEWAEEMMVSVYKYYSNDSGFMSLEEFVKFMADSGVVNTHCPHTQFDEPVIEVAEQLDPVRLLTTLPKVSATGVNDPDENPASAALQDTLQSDRFTVNFTQFYQVLLKISQIVYPSVYEKSKTEAFNKVLSECICPLYCWCNSGHDKHGSTDPLVTDERVALLFMTYAPNLWKVFLSYCQDSSHKPADMKLAYPAYAQACERALFGIPKGAPYTPPANIGEGSSPLDALTPRKSVSNTSNKTNLMGNKSNNIRQSSRKSFTLSSSKKQVNKRYSYTAAIDESHGGAVGNQWQNKEKASSNSEKSKPSAFRTSAQSAAQQAAQYGLFVSEAKALQFCGDFSLLNHLLPSQRIKELIRKLNKKKNITTGNVNTKIDTAPSAAIGKESMTMSQKLKSRRQSVVQGLDDMYKRDTLTQEKYQLSSNDAIARGTFSKKASTGKKLKGVNVAGGLSFSEFLEFIAHLALEGMSQPHYDKMFNSPFAKIMALLTVWGVADTKKLEAVLLLHVDIVLH